MLLTQKFQKINFVRQFIRPIYDSKMVFKLVIYQEWLTSSSWMGDDSAVTSPVIPHSPFHLHHHNIFITFFPPVWEKAATVVALAVNSLDKKIFKNPKKFNCTFLIYIKMYHILKKNLLYWLDIFLALKIKVTALSKFLFFCNVFV